jgi:hypothetical protein
MKHWPAAQTWRRFAIATASAALLAGSAVLAAGCGSGGDSSQSTVATHPAQGGDRSTTTTTPGPAPDKPKSGNPPTESGNPPGSAGQAGVQPPAAFAKVRTCLEQHGVKLPPPGAGGGSEAPGSAKDRRNLITKLRSAFQKCRSELPTNPPANPPQVTAAQRQRARQAAAQQLQRVQAFRACMGRHGFGPEAQGKAQQGDVHKAFAQCGSDLHLQSQGQGDAGSRTQRGSGD